MMMMQLMFEGFSEGFYTLGGLPHGDSNAVYCALSQAHFGRVLCDVSGCHRYLVVKVPLLSLWRMKPRFERRL